jgi:hypothetical protein
MGRVRRNIAKHKLGLIFCLCILAYLALLSSQLPGLRFKAAAVPFLFIALTAAFIVLKVMLFLTNSPRLRRLDELSLIKKMHVPERKEARPVKAVNPGREIGFVLAMYGLLVAVYLIGFLLASLIAGFVFTYLPTRRIRTALVVSVLLAAIAYGFSSVLPGKLWQGLLFGA